MTFDEIYYHYQERCDVNMMTLDQTGVKVHARNGECWPTTGTRPQVSCVKAVAFTIPGTPDVVIEFNDQDTSVAPRAYRDGVQITSFPVTISGVVISSSGTTFSALFPDGLAIDYNRYFALAITAPTSFQNRVDGICGNFNRDNADNTDGSDSLVGTGSSDLFMTTNTECGQKRRRRDEIVVDPNCQITASTECQAIFAAVASHPGCSQLFDVTNFYYACTYDYCNFGDAAPEMVQQIVNSINSRCTVQGDNYNNGVSGSEDTSAPSKTLEETSDENDASKLASSIGMFLVLFFLVLFN
jgi:hypothetical protein